MWLASIVWGRFRRTRGKSKFVLLTVVLSYRNITFNHVSLFSLYLYYLTKRPFDWMLKLHQFAAVHRYYLLGRSSLYIYKNSRHTWDKLSINCGIFQPVYTTDRFVLDRSGSNHFDLWSPFTLALLNRSNSIPSSAFTLTFCVFEFLSTPTWALHPAYYRTTCKRWNLAVAYSSFVVSGASTTLIS